MSIRQIGEIEACLESSRRPTVRDLYDIWNQRVPVLESSTRKQASGALSGQVPWLQSDLAVVTDFAEQALRLEEYLLVRELYAEAIPYWQHQDADSPSDFYKNIIKLQMQYARAQLRLGFFDDARTVLEPRLADRQWTRRQRARMLLLLGHIWREQAYGQPTRSAQQQDAENALTYYLRAEAEDPDLREASVLGAVVMFVLGENEAGRREKAEQRASAILPLLDADDDGGEPNLQSLASRAMLYCVLGKPDEAAALYAKLKFAPDATTSDLAEYRYRSQFLAEAMGEARDFFKPAFPPLQLIVFSGLPPGSGQKQDGPGLIAPDAIPALREKLKRKLDQLQARVGLVGAAAGADLLFIEALAERPGFEFHLVLPWSKNEFYETSVKPFEPREGEPIWKPLFERAMERAATVRELGQVFQPAGDLGWEYTHEVTAGLALLTARILRLDVQPLVMWNPTEGSESGATSSFYQLWSDQMQQSPAVVDPDGLLHATKPASAKYGARIERPTTHQEVKTMLFADIVGYSKLPETVMQAFVDHFMGKISGLLASSADAPRSINTWGDALYAVFDYTHQAGNFALALARMVLEGEPEWLKNGLFYEELDGEGRTKVQKPLNIRIGLHTGPVLVHYNPVLRQVSYTGTHVSRAARIEPIATPGEVYASEEFAAMSELASDFNHRNPGSSGTSHSAFVCEFVGTRPLAKGYPGRFRIYRVRPQPLAGMDDLARAVHESYCAKQRADGVKSPLPPWDQLPEGYREDNRAQVADIPNKLRYLGYELAAGTGLDPRQIKISDEQLETLAEREHERWMRQKLRQGWTLGPKDSDPRKKTNPFLLPYAELQDSIKDYDREPVRKMPEIIAQAGFRVRKLSTSTPL
jgi:class 3 adenylate cyclase